MKKNLKALGFVEVVIAIAVAGIVSAVFMTIAGKAMKSLIQTERIESMARIATDGANIAQEIANQEKADFNVGDFFPSESIDVGYCFVPYQDVEGDNIYYYFLADGETGEFESIRRYEEETIDIPGLSGTNAVVREDVRDWFVYNAAGLYTDYFLVMCIDGIDEVGTSWANVSFIVGDVNVDGVVTNDTDLKDFTYYAVIDL